MPLRAFLGSFDKIFTPGKTATSGGAVTTTGSNQKNGNGNANKSNKNQKPNSGESKGLAGGNITSTNINTNMKNIRPGAAALSKVMEFFPLLGFEP